MKIVWIALVWPEPDSSAAGLRTNQLIQALKQAGHDVEVCSPCKDNKYRFKLEESGIRTASFGPNDSAFDNYLTSVNPDIVFFDRFMAEEQFGWRVRKQTPQALRILDSVDLHSLRRARGAAIKNCQTSNLLCPGPGEVDLNSEAAQREVASIYRSDVTLIISDYELELLKAYYRVPEELIALVRLYCPLTNSFPNFSARKNFVSIGNFNHEPNLDSFRILNQILWPKIRQQLIEAGIQEPEVHIYGAYPSADFLKLSNPHTGFLVKGWSENALETLKSYRVNLAPLRFGAGIKGKVLDGWAVGTPCVGTSIAAEGIHPGFEFGGFIENDFESFTTRVAQLYCDEDRWKTAQAHGAEIITKHYNNNQIHNFLDILDKALKSKEQRRSNNFTGLMLWHHSLRSTEYFSRWIEEKNRRS